MIEMVQYDYIRYLYFNEGLNQRSIAKKIGVHRKTVKRAIENTEQKYNLTAVKDKPINGKYEDLVEKLLSENSTKPRKHKLTKKRMYELLQEEDYEGSYSAFTSLTRFIEQKLNINVSEAFLKLKHKPGTLQVDFGEMVVMQNHVPRKIIVFCAKLCNSKIEFIKAYPKQSTEFFLDGLNSAFKFLGGIPRKIMFDNLKQAVKNMSVNGGRILQDSFIRFKSFYAFDAVFCGPRKGNEKGAVENLVKYTRNNYFLPYLEFDDFESLNRLILKHCIKRMNTGKADGKTWLELFDKEKETGFLELKDIYDPSVIVEAKVDTYQLIHIESNRYSVPTQYVGHTVQVRLYPFKVVIYEKGVLIAEHERLFGRNKESLDPYHFLDLLQRKPRAYEDAEVIQDWKLPQIFSEYHHQLQAHRQSISKGTKEFIDILKLTKKYGIKRIEYILNDFNKANRYSYQEILSYLRSTEESKSNSLTLDYDTLEKLNVLDIKSENMPLDAYSDLMNIGGGMQ